MKTLSHTFTVNSALALIEEARDAELRRDADLTRKILEPVWPNIEIEPVYSDFPVTVEAELLRISGFFLSFYGKSKSLASYQLRGKDLLSKSIRLFLDENATERAAEANAMLALCYWYSGEIAECDVVLRRFEDELTVNTLHPVHLQTQIIRLLIMIWEGRHREALAVLEDLATPFSLCSDIRLKSKFHNQAGIIYRANGLAEKAEFHYKEAIRTATVVGNTHLIGLNLNNLAFFYRDLGKFADAHASVDQAIDVFKQNNDIGWIPQAEDSKANIYLAEGRVDLALETIDQALRLFVGTEDHASVVESMWTRCRCLFLLGRTEEALSYYGELYSVAATQIGSNATDKYVKALAGMVHCSIATTYEQKLRDYNKDLIKRSLIDAKGHFSNAAASLDQSQQAFSYIVNEKFPELYEELGIKRRRARSNDRSVNASATVAVLPHTRLERVEIDGSYRFPGNVARHRVRVYNCREFMLGPLQIYTAAQIAVRPLRDKASGTPILYGTAEKYGFAVIREDLQMGYMYIEPAPREMYLIDEVKILGEPFAYLPADRFAAEVYDFEPL